MEWGRACSRAASTSPRTWCGSRGNRSRRWAGVTGPTRACSLSNRSGLQVLVVPRQISLQSVAPVARLVDAVVLTWINDQLGFHAETSQRLVHLLRIEERDVEVLVAAQEQRRRGDPIGVQERE